MPPGDYELSWTPPFGPPKFVFPQYPRPITPNPLKIVGHAPKLLHMVVDICGQLVADPKVLRLTVPPLSF